LSRVLARARSEDSLALGLSNDNALLEVSLRGNAVRKFTLPLLDLSAGELPTPNIDFDVNLIILADILQDGVKDAKLFNTYVTLKAENDDFLMVAKGTSGNNNFKLVRDDNAMISMEVKNASSSSFPLDYLEDILKQASKETNVNLSFKANSPIKISYNISDASLVYFVAPRAEAD
ncbi:MAG: hypothetical protein GOV15_04310, partial [Candidatus Diapherotrites archaeon]|nr:hypothetical protein [Candidatus Diapherotrites archaeon]